MSKPTRPMHRFLPTLTEVVDPEAWLAVGKTVSSGAPDINSAAMHQMESRVEPNLAHEFEALVRKLVAEQMQSMQVSMRQELEVIVRQAVSEALGSNLNSDK